MERCSIFSEPKPTKPSKLTFDRLKNRIDKFGVIQRPNVSLDPARDQIAVELPGIENAERGRKLLQTTAKLEFWDVYRVSDPSLTSPSILNAFSRCGCDPKETIARCRYHESGFNRKIDTLPATGNDALGNTISLKSKVDTTKDSVVITKV